MPSNIPPGALRQAQALANNLLIDTLRVERAVTITTDFGEDKVWRVIHEGVGRIAPDNNRRVQIIERGQKDEFRLEYIGTLPVGSPGVVLGDRVTVVVSRNQDLVGRQFVVSRMVVSSFPVSVRFHLAEVLVESNR